MKRAVLLALVLVGGCKDKSAAVADAGAGPDPSTLLPECEKADGRANADECYEKHAVKVQKVAFCERIVGPRPKNTCFQRIATATLDGELCTKIDESISRFGCRTDVAKKKGDAELCKKIDKPEVATLCIREVARSKKDAALCDSITVADARAECISGVAIEKPEVCDLIKDAAAKDKCWGAAAARHDPLLCEKTSDTHKCYAAAVAAIGDETTCSKIPKPEDADACWSEIAVKKHDAKMCDKLTTNKKACVDAVASAPGVDTSKIDGRIRKGITKVSTTEFTVTREAVDLVARDSSFTTSMRIVPEMHEGKTVGIRVFGIRQDSIPGLLGLENGDRLEKVNGFDLSSPEQALEAYPKLAKASKIDLQIVRRGTPMTIAYTIK